MSKKVKIWIFFLNYCKKTIKKQFLDCWHWNLKFNLVVSSKQNFFNSLYSSYFRFDKKVGDAVAADEVVMEIETDKTTVGVPSPAHGIIEEIYVADGDTVKSGQQLFKLKVTGEAPAKAAAAEAPKPAAAAPKLPQPP